MPSQYDVNQSVTRESGRPTTRMREIIELIKCGFALEGHFDVYGGYWWTQQEYSVARSTVQGLLDRRLIEKLPSEHVYLGRQRIPFRLTVKS